MTPVREALFARLKVELALISAATSPYTNTIQLVSRKLVTANDFVSVAALPGIGIIDKGDESPEQMSSNIRIYRAQISLVVYFAQQPGDEAASTLGNSLYGDVMYAMTAPSNRTHNDTCIHTYDKGLTKLDPGQGDEIGGLLMDFECLYENTWSAP